MPSRCRSASAWLSDGCGCKGAVSARACQGVSSSSNICQSRLSPSRCSGLSAPTRSANSLPSPRSISRGYPTDTANSPPSPSRATKASRLPQKAFSIDHSSCRPPDTRRYGICAHNLEDGISCFLRSCQLGGIDLIPSPPLVLSVPKPFPHGDDRCWSGRYTFSG